VRESVDIIRAAGATPAGVVIAIDRQERGTGTLSAVQEVERDLGLPVIAVARLTDVIDYLAGQPALEQNLAAVRRYRETYGVA
jgi:orotate phosphoribosyltransferase